MPSDPRREASAPRRSRADHPVLCRREHLVSWMGLAPDRRKFALGRVAAVTACPSTGLVEAAFQGSAGTPPPGALRPNAAPSATTAITSTEMPAAAVTVAVGKTRRSRTELARRRPIVGAAARHASSSIPPVSAATVTRPFPK